MNNTIPDAVKRLIDVMAKRGYALPEDTQLPGPIERKSEPMPELLLFSNYEQLVWKKSLGNLYRSVTELFQQEGDDCNEIACVVSMDYSSPKLAGLKMHHHDYDIFAAAKTVLEYLEGKERLPFGFAENACSWLSVSTQSCEHEDPEDHKSALKRNIDAVTLFLEAMYSASDVLQVPLLQSVFGFGPDSKNMILWMEANSPYRNGNATVRFCNTIANPDSEHYSQVLAAMFEYNAREVLTREFISYTGFRYGLKSDGAKYAQLPRPQVVGALTHLSLPKPLGDGKRDLVR